MQEIFQTFNWTDWIILFLLIVFTLDGFRSGFILLGSGFVAYIAAFYIAVYFHIPVGQFVVNRFGIDAKWSDLAGYITVIFVVQIIIAQMLMYTFKRFGKRIWSHRLDSFFGSLFSFANTFISIALGILLIVALPVPSYIKNPVSQSYLSQKILVLAEKYAKPLKETVETTAREVTKFITIQPQSSDSIPLDIDTQAWDLLPDESGERKMVDMVNAERIKVGTVSLVEDESLQSVARSHSMDMLMRKYFSHFSPEGYTIKERLDAAHISYVAAAENLAFAPSLYIAHSGLMASPGHKVNILDPSYNRIGIGIIDAGQYGKMITQVFITSDSLFKNRKEL